MADPFDMPGGPAFPISIPGVGDNGCPGMSLLDWYAGQALMGFCVGMTPERCKDIADGVQGGRFEVQASRILAKRMLEERQK